MKKLSPAASYGENQNLRRASLTSTEFVEVNVVENVCQDEVRLATKLLRP